MMMNTELWWNDADRGKPKYLEKNLFLVTLATANLIRLNETSVVTGPQLTTQAMTQPLKHTGTQVICIIFKTQVLPHRKHTPSPKQKPTV